MLRYVAPLEQKLRHISPPTVPARKHPNAMTAHKSDKSTTSQRLAEHAAAIVGSWKFLIIQAGVLAAWVMVNSLRLAGFDPPPFILLNLLLSFQAAFTGPVLLIAANVGALRDHRQYDRIEHLSQQNEQLAEQNEQLAEQNANLMQRLSDLEQQILAKLETHNDAGKRATARPTGRTNHRSPA